MRLFGKLLLLIVLFVCAATHPFSRPVTGLTYELRVVYVLALGNAADLDRLVDDTQRHLAEQQGCLDLYLKGKRVRQLLEQRLAEAAARGIRLDDDDIALIREECQMAAFAGEPVRRHHCRSP